MCTDNKCIVYKEIRSLSRNLNPAPYSHSCSEGDKEVLTTLQHQTVPTPLPQTHAQISAFSHAHSHATASSELHLSHSRARWSKVFRPAFFFLPFLSLAFFLSHSHSHTQNTQTLSIHSYAYTHADVFPISHPLVFPDKHNASKPTRLLLPRGAGLTIVAACCGLCTARAANKRNCPRRPDKDPSGSSLTTSRCVNSLSVKGTECRLPVIHASRQLPCSSECPRVYIYGGEVGEGCEPTK